MKKCIINDKATQVKLIFFWIVFLVIALFITLLRSQPAGSRLAFASNRLRNHVSALAVTSASAGRLTPTGLPGIIFSPKRADGLSRPETVTHQPGNDWLDELIERIWTVESGRRLNPPDGDGGQAIGPLQIHADVLKDVNGKYRTKFTCADLRNLEKAKLVARLYIKMWMEKHREEIAARIFNGGPRGWNEKSTDNYWRKINGK